MLPRASTCGICGAISARLSRPWLSRISSFFDRSNSWTKAVSDAQSPWDGNKPGLIDITGQVETSPTYNTWSTFQSGSPSAIHQGGRTE